MLENTLRYSSFADKSQVQDRVDSYDTLMVPSNLLIGGEKAVPSLLDKLMDEHSLDYYIDPSLTDLRIGRNFRNGDDEIKNWHKKLIEHYGDPVERIMDDADNLDPQNISEDDKEQIARYVVKFQENFVPERVEEDVGKYELPGEEDSNNSGPKAIIPLYTKIDSDADLDTNEELIETSKDEAEIPIKPCIFVTIDYLKKEDTIDNIKQMLERQEIDDAFIWIEDLDKFETTISEYITTIKFVEELSQSVNPHFMYGDFFANLLYYFGLNGTSFGTYHSESSKEKKKNEGGGFLQRYYLDPLKEFLTIPQAVEVLERSNVDSCECETCKEVLVSPTDLLEQGDDHDFLKDHFIRVKERHKVLVDEEELNSVLESMENNREAYEDEFDGSEISRTKDVTHLKKWKESIEKYQEDSDE